MKYMHYRKLFTFIGLIFVAVTMHAEDDVSVLFTDDDDLPMSGLGKDPVREGSCPFASIVVPVLAESGAIEIFKQNIYVGTAPFAVRDVLDFPIWQTPLPSINRWNFSVDPFYNKTNRSVFAPCLPDICGGIGFCNQALLDSIQNAANNIINNPTFYELIVQYLGGSIVNFLKNHNIHEVAAAFAPATIEQRRAGALFSITENRDRWIGDIRIPLYWFERNIFIDDADRKKIEAIFPKSDALSEADAETFARQHLVADKFGIGDLRFTLAYQLIDKQKAKLNLAGFFTAPTAAAFQRGIVGSSFACVPEPDLDLCELLNHVQEIKAKTQALGIAFIDRFSAIFMEEELGSGKHWGLGSFIEPIVDFNDNVHWHARLFAQYYFSNSRKRYFAKAADINAFNAHDFFSTNLEQAAENLMFISKRIEEMLFPQQLLVHVRPGAVWMLLNEFMFNFDHWDASIGVDWYHKGSEHLAIPTLPDDKLFMVQEATRGAAEEIKLLGGLGYTFRTASADWYVGMKGDGTVYNRNIGKDWTIALSLGISW